MSHLSIVSESTQGELTQEESIQAGSPSDVEKCVNACKEQFNQILSGILEGESQEAHKVEKSIFKELMRLGLLLLNLCNCSAYLKSRFHQLSEGGFLY